MAAANPIFSSLVDQFHALSKQAEESSWPKPGQAAGSTKPGSIKPKPKSLPLSKVPTNNNVTDAGDEQNSLDFYKDDGIQSLTLTPVSNCMATESALKSTREDLTESDSAIVEAKRAATASSRKAASLLAVSNATPAAAINWADESEDVIIAEAAFDPDLSGCG